MTVRHLLEQKGRNVWTIDPDATVLDAVAKMADKDVGSLVMMDGEKLVGNGAFYSPIAYPKTAVV